MSRPNVTLSPIEIIVAERVLPHASDAGSRRWMHFIRRKCLAFFYPEFSAGFAGEGDAPKYDLKAAYRYGRLLGIRATEFGVEGMVSPWSIVLDELGQIADYTTDRDIGLSAPDSHRRALLVAIRTLVEGAVVQLNGPPLADPEQALLYRLSFDRNRRRGATIWLASYVMENPLGALQIWGRFPEVGNVAAFLEPGARELRSLQALFIAN